MDTLHIHIYDLSIYDVKLKLRWAFCKLKKGDSYGPDELFVRRAIRNWVFYIDIQKHILYFKPLVNTLAQILLEIWHFQDLTYFLTSRPNYLTFGL